jgi:hypothetical protein
MTKWTIAVEHVRIESAKPFDEVRAALERSVPHVIGAQMRAGRFGGTCMKASATIHASPAAGAPTELDPVSTAISPPRRGTRNGVAIPVHSLQGQDPGFGQCAIHDGHHLLAGMVDG